MSQLYIYIVYSSIYTSSKQKTNIDNLFDGKTIAAFHLQKFYKTLLIFSNIKFKWRKQS